MKKILILIFLVFCLGLQAQTETKTTVIFIDNSASSVDDSSVLDSKRENLLETVWNAAQIDGSIVILSYIYENSSSVSNKRVFKFEAPKLDETALVGSELDFERERLLDAIEEERAYFTELVVEKALAYKPDRPATYILSTLSLLQSWKQEYGSLNVAYFSDMIEASNVRALANTKFSTLEQARNLGRVDAKKTADTYELKSHFLKDVSVSVFLPVQDMDNRKVFRFLPAYWGEVFSSVGLSSSNLKFQ